LSAISLVGGLSKYECDRKNDLHIISFCGVEPKLKAAGQKYSVNWNKFDTFMPPFVLDFVSRDDESV
jgi:hypothetical protein